MSQRVPEETDNYINHVLEEYKPIEKMPDHKDEIKLNPKSIHWRNLPLLTKFMTPYGTILNKRESGLDLDSFRKVVKSIKQAQYLLLLPCKSFLRSYHKKPLKTL